MELISRNEAKERGLKRYFTGKTCARDHLAERLISDYSCTECNLIDNRKKEQSPERKAFKQKWIKEYREKHPERQRATEQRRQEKHGPERAKARRISRANGTEDYKSVLRKSFQKNKAKRMAESKAWRKANPEQWSLYMRAAKAKRRAAEGKYTAQDVADLMEKQNGICVGCSTDIRLKFHVDHVQPLARGGTNWPDNLQLLCGPCNQSKGAKTMTEWMAHRVELGTSLKA